MFIIFIVVILVFIILLLPNIIRIQNDKKKPIPIIDLPNTAEKSEIEELEKILLKNPTDIPSLFSIANLYFEKKQYNMAQNNIKILLEQDLSQMRNLKIKTLTLAFDISFNLNNLEDAEHYAQNAYKIDSTNIETLKRMCQAKYHKGDFEKAAELGKNITVLAPMIFEGYYYWGMAEYQRNNINSTLQNLKNALKIKSNDFNSIITIGKAYAKKKDTENALKHYNDAIKFATEQKEQIDILYNRGILFKNNNKLDDATEDFKTLLKKSPENGTKLLTLKHLIDIKKEKKEISQVIWYIKDLLTLKPNDEHFEKELQYYLELDSSTMFQKFEMANGNEFLQLCTEIVKMISPVIKISEAKIKEDQSVEIIIVSKDDNNNHKEIIWFVRSTNPIGVIPINNLYAKMKQTSSKECKIVSNTTFSEEAKHFSHTRMISLVEKKGLIKQLNKIVEKKELEKSANEIDSK